MNESMNTMLVPGQQSTDWAQHTRKSLGFFGGKEEKEKEKDEKEISKNKKEVFLFPNFPCNLFRFVKGSIFKRTQYTEDNI